MLCLNCDKELKTNPKFCSKSCAASFNNKLRIRTEKSKQKTRETIVIKRYGSLDTWDRIKKIKEQDRVLQKEKGIKYKCSRIFYKKCSQCETLFIAKYSSVSHCSKSCKSKTLSIKTCERISKLGTNNWSSHVGLFEYKNLKIQVDSKLEKCGIIYLHDIFEADKIEKFKNILNFTFENKSYSYNPDFYVKKNDKIFIVEVKMKWNQNSSHSYYKLMQPKKTCLQEFCKKKNFEAIWLDFDYDIKFKNLYKNFTKLGH